MAWIKVESSVARNRKFLNAGAAASWLWLCGLAYCQEGLTDGFIPVEALPLLGIDPKDRKNDPRKLATRLVLAHLWDVVEGGWQIHDYLKHNKSADDVQMIRKELLDASARGGIASGVARRANSVKQTLQDGVEVPIERVQSTCEGSSNPAQYSSVQLISAQLGTARARPSPIIAKRRADAAWEGPRVYVPQRTHSDFVALRNHSDAERELFEWYAQVSEEWTVGVHKDVSPGADMIKFWKVQYDRRWPAPTASGTTIRRPAWAPPPKAGA